MGGYLQLLCFVLTLVIGASTSAANGGESPAESKADATVKQANAQARQGNTREAIRLFKTAISTNATAELKCKVGLLYASLRHDPQAHWYLSQCKDQWSDKEFPKWAQDSLDIVIDRLKASAHARVVIISKTESRAKVSWFADNEVVDLPAELWAPLGKHTIKMPNGTAHEVAVKSVDDQTVVVGNVEGNMPKTPEDIAPVTTSSPVLAKQVPTIVPMKDTGPRKTSKTIPIIVLASGGALIGAGAIMHGFAHSSRGKLASASTQQEYDELKPTFTMQRSLAVSFYAAGAVTTGIGAWLYYRAKKADKNQDKLTLGADFGAQSFALTLSWRQ